MALFQVSEILLFTQIFMVFCNKNHWQQQQQQQHLLTSHVPARVRAGGRRNISQQAAFKRNGRKGEGSDGSISPILAPGFLKMEDLANNNRLVGGWNMNVVFPYIGNHPN